MRTRIRNRYFGRPVGSLVNITALPKSESASAIQNADRKRELLVGRKWWDSETLGQIIRTESGMETAQAKVKKPSKMMAKIRKRAEMPKLKRWT